MVHIRIFPLVNNLPEDRVEPEWSRGDYIQMIKRVQENGAAGLWSFELMIVSLCWQEGCEAMRVGWLDVPRQPTLRGEWQFDLFGTSSDSDVPLSI